MQCEEYQISIQRYLDNDLNEIEEKELFAHMEQCSSCQKEFDEYQSLHTELLQLPSVEIDTSCIDDLLRRIDSQSISQFDSQSSLQENSNVSVLRKYSKYITPMIAAAALVLVFFAGKGFFSSELPYAEKLQADPMESMEMAPSAEDNGDTFSALEGPDNGLRMFTTSDELNESEGGIMNQFGVDKSLLDPIPFIVEDSRNVPTVIRNWVERSKGIFAGQSYVHRGRTYIYVSLGQRNSIDYKVSIAEMYHKDGQLYAYTQVNEPQIVTNETRSTVYPNLLVSVDGEYIDVHFNEWQGAEIETWIPEIYGIEMIPNFNRQSSDIIKMYSPTPDLVIEDSIEIKGIARTFDGSVYYRVITAEQEEIASGFIFATRGAPDWGHFEQEIFIDLPHNIQAVQAYIEVYEISLRDGGQLGTVTIPITLQTTQDSLAIDMQNKHWITYVVKSVDAIKGLIGVEQYFADSQEFHAPKVLDLNGVPIVRDITQEKANTVALHAQVSDIKPNHEIGVLINDDGKVKQVFLFE